MSGKTEIPSAGDSRRTDIYNPNLGHSRTHIIKLPTSRSTGLPSQDKPLMGLRDQTFVVEDKATPPPQT